MNAGCLRVTVALWIMALVAGGYAESDPNRPTAGDLDEIVAQGTECMLAVNERCQATQFATNSISYLDQNAMGTMASKIRSLVPYYVDLDTVYDGTTNIVLLTVPGVWADLLIGDYVTNFTYTPAIGTNPATYGDNPWRIYPEGLEERYDVLYSLQKTKVGAIVRHDANKLYHGEGCGTTWVEAVAAAVNNYAAFPSGGLYKGQHCKGVLWSNYYSHTVAYEGANLPGSWGRTYGTNLIEHWHWWLEVTVESNWYYTYTTNLVITGSNSSTETVTTNYDAITNVLVSGTATPDVTGTYTRFFTEYFFKLFGDDAALIYDYGFLDYAASASAWVNPIASPLGTFYANVNATGDLTVTTSDQYVFTNGTDALPPVDGYYTYAGTNESGSEYWACAARDCIVIMDVNTNYNLVIGGTNHCFFRAGSPFGVYTALGHTGTAIGEAAIVTNQIAGNYDPTGNYDGGTIEGPGGGTRPNLWWGGGSFAVVGAESNCYLTVDYPNAFPAWLKEADNIPDGDFATLVGSGVYGVVHSTIHSNHWLTETNVYSTNTYYASTGKTGGYTNTEDAVTVFYQCWLTKGGWSNDVYATTSLSHQVAHYAYPITTTVGYSNVYDELSFDDGAIGANRWHLIHTGDWTTNENESAWIGGDTSSDTFTTTEPTTPNQSLAVGWVVEQAPVGVIEFDFDYCTDK